MDDYLKRKAEDESGHVSARRKTLIEIYMITSSHHSILFWLEARYCKWMLDHVYGWE